MQGVNMFFSKISSVVWGPAMLGLLVGIGVYFTIRTRFFQFTHFFDMLRSTIGSLGKPYKANCNGISPFQAVSTALAGTLGIGNIVGVATAIAAGGPGAVFWMWVSAFFGMMTKYAEVALAVKYREVENGKPYGGPMFVIYKGLKCKPLAYLFCLFCMFASFGIGSTVQSNAAAGALNSGFGVPLWISAILFGGLSLIVIVGGVQRIGAAAERIVPVMAAIYILLALFVVFCNFDQILPSFQRIFQGAFCVSSSAAGGMGYLTAQAIRYGVSRGVFSNEAGLGSAPIAHAASDAESPKKQAYWGIFEVFFDTIVMCTLTALVLISTGAVDMEVEGSAMTLFAFSQQLGSLAGGIIAVCMTFFAFASILGWAYYGEQCAVYLFGRRVLTLYRVLYALSAGVGCVCALSAVWQAADAMNGLMAVPNLICIVLLRREVVETTKDPCAKSIPRKKKSMRRAAKANSK